MIHPETQKVIDYPNTVGKRAAMSHYNWKNIEKVQEVMVASSLISLAKTIDKQTK